MKEGTERVSVWQRGTWGEMRRERNILTVHRDRKTGRNEQSEGKEVALRPREREGQL